jgi:hypothetical protein
VVDVFERLGNQLFQFAAGKQLEMDGLKVLFSDRTRGKLSALEGFVGEKLPLATPWQELATGYLPPMNPASLSWSVALRQPLIAPTVHRIYRPDAFGPRPEQLPSYSLYRIRGYFQNFSWIDRSLDLMVKGIDEANREVRSRLPAFDLCINLRRGDYIGLGWDLSFQHYAASLKALSDHSIKSVVVNSDDRLVEQVFCEYLAGRGFDAHPASSVVTSDDGDAISPAHRDFFLIANARNVIMSNSTFCWWATLVGDQNVDIESRTVIYPLGWLQHVDHIDEGLKRPSWTAIA